VVEGNQVDGASLLLPFLPPTAAKLLCFSNDNYNQIEWNKNLSIVPLSADLKNSLFKWTGNISILVCLFTND
jgi:hypothetical protein